jgi:eukaryotic-like serine/threonine-protein kinase
VSVKLANVGDVLADKYRVDKILGIGGMGMVVQAVNLDLELKVALKFMLPQALESPEASARFLREARAAGKLTGEHVCRVMDVGRFPGGAPYIVMEYLEGYDLMTLLKRRGPLPISEAIDYLLQACEGMAEAHALGIVHRDLKPDNLFLATRVDGSKIIKVLDFGISKATVTGLQTKTGDVLGSPAYMAPEQMQATKDVDARADIWSLGVVLYQLLAGKMAFSGETLPQLCMAVMNEEPKSLMSIRGDIPPPLADAVQRALEKNRNERYDDVSEFAQAIAPFGGATAVGAVTRVRSLLRGRATPQTLPPTAEELLNGSGDVLPTLVGASMPGMAVIPRTDDTPVMRNKPSHMPTPPVMGNTTLASSAGESLELPRRRMPLGVVGVVVGTVGMIVVIVVMAMRRTERDATQSVVPAAGSVQEVAPPPTPTVEPIVEPPVTTPTPAPVVVDAQPPEPEPKKPRTKKKDQAAGSAATPAVTPDAGVPDEEDKWGKMLDDKPGEKKPE